jgi:hypothetical protein
VFRIFRSEASAIGQLGQGKMEYFYAASNEQRGPHTLEQLFTVGLKPDTLVWHDGLPEWMPAGTLPELAPLFGAPQPQFAPPPPAAPIPTASMPTAPLPVSALPYQVPASIGSPQNGMAIASLVLGIVSLVTILCYGFGLIPGILAIVFGILARKEIRRTEAQGMGMAMAGIVCGSIAIGLLVLGVIAIIVAIAMSH